MKIEPSPLDATVLELFDDRFVCRVTVGNEFWDITFNRVDFKIPVYEFKERFKSGNAIKIQPTKWSVVA